MAKESLNKVAKALKTNRILMIVCVFVVMGLAVALIQFLQEKTLERFTSAYALNSINEPTELNGGAHGELHVKDNGTPCVHDNTDGTHTCGHAHTENRAKELIAAGYGTSNAAYTMANNGTLPEKQQ